MKAKRWMAAAFVCIALSACGGGKQEAAVALDEARLSVSSARKAGAEASSPARLAEAVTALSAAEDSFKRKKFDAARDSAHKARDAARLAEAAAKAKGAEGAPRKRKAKARK